MNADAFRGCTSEICKLNDSGLTNLKKIKAHCLTCVPEQSLQGVRSCDGHILIDGTPAMCSLHPFRLGHNPKRAGIGGKNLTHGASFVFKRGQMIKKDVSTL